MSDSVEELSKDYRRNVSRDHRRRIGLFTIPEVPEDPGMWSTVVDVVLTSLRYLAPATLLTLLWGQNSFLYKLLKYIDSAFRSVVYSSDEQKQTVLQWLETAGTVRVDKLETVWRHGWIVCGVLDIAIPGACAGHPPTKLSLKHAQSIAEEYLGVEPIFTPQELESIDTLGKHQEWKLITFLDSIREALIKITPPSKPSPIRFAAESTQHTFDYIAKGSGLVAAQVKNKAFFKIYPTAQQSLNPGDINIEIKGPNKSHGTFTLPAVLGKAQVIRQSLLGRKATTNYTENILPVTQGASYLRNFGKNDMSKTYFIPKLKSNIDIDSETNDDHVKIGYTVEYEGKYEISITSKNLSIAGSPFSMVASNDIVETLENDNFTLEDGEEIDIVDVSTDKKAVIRIVDFVTEKMLLKEDGCLQRISIDEAKQLMEACNKENLITENDNVPVILTANTDIRSKKAFKLFYEASRKIIIMLRVSKCFWDYKRILKTDKVTESKLRNQGIPDVVNSTLNDYHVNTGFVPTVSDRYIIPEPISVSLKTEKLNEYLEKEPGSKKADIDSYGPLIENIFDDDIQNLSNNPFTEDTFAQGYTTEKKLSSFITTEYEANNSQSEELQNQSIALANEAINKEISDGNHSTNPFTEMKENDFSKADCNSGVKKSFNPFDDTKNEDCYTPENQAEFIIGAPVTLPPNLVTTSIESINTVASNTSSDTASCDKSETSNNISQNNTQLLDEKNLNNSNFTTISPNKDMWDSAYVSIDDNNSSEVTSNECVEESYKLKQVFTTDKTPTTESLRERLLHDIRERSNYIDSDNSKKKIHESKKYAFMPIHEENDKYETHVSTKLDLMSKSETDSVTEAFAELDDIYDDYFSEEVDNTDKKLQTKECNTLVDSASEKVSDVKRQTTTSEGKTSEIQANVTESVSASQILHTEMAMKEKSYRRRSDETQFGDKIYSNIVIEKKLYWDEKIRQIQAKEQELKSLKRRLSSKYLRRNDSLTKKRGKKIVKNFLNLAEKETGNGNWNTNSESTYDDFSHESTHNKAKLKDSLRNYWDSKVQAMDSCFGKKSEKDIHAREVPHVNTEKAVAGCKGHDITKQDLPEKVFEAFETSPKRFFGTSRQQILNKIDTYLGKSEQEDEIKSINSEISHDSGLVSSRISLFHNIAETESAPSPFRKHKSLNNICTEKVSMHSKNYNTNEHQNLLDSENNESNCSKIANIDKFDKNSNLIKEPIVSFQVKKLEGNENMKNDNAIVDTPVDIVLVSENYNPNENITKRSDHNMDTYPNNFDKINEILDTDDYKNNKRNDSLLRNNLNSFSKSEMDIFSKTSKTIDIDLDIHKSFEELPKNSVKKFISLYEDVSKSSDQTNLIESCKKSRKKFGNGRNESSTGGTAREPQFETQVRKDVKRRKKTKTLNDNMFESNNTTGSDNEVISVEDKCASRLSLYDIDIEIIESPDDTTDTDKLVPEDYIDYKNRFKMATQFFKSLEELRIDKKPKEVKEKVEEITDTPEESLDRKDGNEKVKKSNIKKSHTMPSSELSKIWNRMQENNISPKRLMKISEKFNVEDLYEDVMEGRLSRQGSLRGIPNKKAVLETFRSMENMPQHFNSYAFATSQTADFEKENRTRPAQTYLSEYPYLPTTDPSKFHSRLDASASGLITFKELKELKHNRKYRRNSVPNSSINHIFTANL